MKRLIALLLTIVMVVSLCPFSAMAAGGATNVVLSVDKTEVNVGDTFTVTIGLNDLTVSSVAFGFDFDKELAAVDLIDDYYFGLVYYDANSRPRYTYLSEWSSKEEANRDGHVGLVVASGREYAYDASEAYVIIDFTAKKAGTVEFKMFEDSAGHDGYKGNWTHTTTVTIKDPAPACTHENTKYVANNNGTHNIVCTAEGCGVTVKENEDCSGGTATCAAKAKCVYCEAEYGVLAGHTYGNLIPATEAVHNEDELKAAVAAHYFCDVCDTYFDANKNVTTLAALTGETPVHTADPSKTTTNTKEPTCTEEGTEVVSTFCSCGYAFDKIYNTIPVNPDAHNWGTPTYGWNSDNSYYQATRVCQIEACKKTETINATITSEQIADPTCGEAGQTKHTATFEEDWAHTQYWTEDLPGATGNHTYDNACDADCNECGVIRTPADHVYDNDCDKNCKICGEPTRPDADHSYTYDCDKNCKFCGVTTRPEAKHVSDADHPCLDGKCVYCEVDMPATVEHSYKNACDADCDICGDAREVSDHVYDNACDADCNVCGATRTPADHVYNNACDADCNECGATRTPADHVYDNACDAECNVCNAPRTPADHVYDNDCDKNCKVCGEPTRPDADHSYTYNCDKNCKFCGEPTRPDADHSYTYDCDKNCKFCGVTTRPDADHELVYTDLEDGNHSVSCDVCKKTLVPSEAHNFKNDKHECACRVVETFTLTAGYFDDDGIYKEVVISIPFGAAVADYLPELNSYTEDDGSLYEFKEWFECPETMPAEDLEVSAIYYFTGWNLYYSGSVYEGAVYVIHDKEQKTGWTKIGDDWYYLDTETGFRAEGLKRVPYPTEAINGVTYAPNAEDLTYAAGKGKTFVNAESAVFLFDENGKFQSSFTGIVPSEADPSSYAVNGMVDWHVGLVKVGEDYYYFLGDEDYGMNVMQTGDVYVTRKTTEREVHLGGIYTFADDGKLIENNGIVDMSNGTKRYYEDAELMVGNGLTKVGENYIYVRTNGELVVNYEYYVPANDLNVVHGMYMFDENGFMVNPVPTTKNGVYFENGAWYCYVDGVKAYNLGLTSFEGTWYGADGEKLFEDDVWIYVRSNGALATGAYYVTTVNHPDAPVDAGTKCQFNEYGILVEDLNGIVSENNSLYYYENNSIAYNKGVIEIDGDYYYVKSNGEVVNNREYWITNVGDSGVIAKAYTFDENGVMLNPEFKGEEANGIVDGYYYVDGKLAYCAGLLELEDEDGKFYIYVRSNGQLATGKYWPTNKNGIDVVGALDFGTDGKYYF